jgi:hypothetical protein
MNRLTSFKVSYIASGFGVSLYKIVEADFLVEVLFLLFLDSVEDESYSLIVGEEVVRCRFKGTYVFFLFFFEAGNPILY